MLGETCDLGDEGLTGGWRKYHHEEPDCDQTKKSVVGGALGT